MSGRVGSYGSNAEFYVCVLLMFVGAWLFDSGGRESGLVLVGLVGGWVFGRLWNEIEREMTTPEDHP